MSVAPELFLTLPMICSRPSNLSNGALSRAIVVLGLVLIVRRKAAIAGLVQYREGRLSNE